MTRVNISLDPIALAPVRRALEARIKSYEGLIDGLGTAAATARTAERRETLSTNLYKTREELTHLRSTLDQIKENMNG